MKRLVLVLAALLCAATAQAQVAPYTNVTPTLKALNNVALNAAAGARTIVKNLYRNGVQQPAFAKARMVINYTFGAATTATVTFFCSEDGVNFGQLAARNISGPTSTVTPVTDVFASGASASLYIDFDVRGCLVGKWVFAGTGSPSGADLVTVDLTTLTGE